MIFETTYHSGYGQRPAEQWGDDGYRRWDYDTGELVEERPLTDKELLVFGSKRDEETSHRRHADARDGVRDLARGALRTNVAYLRLPLATPEQTAAQVAALTRQVSALVRLVLDDFDGEEPQQ